MKKFLLILIGLFLLMLAAGAIYLLTADIPAPTQRIEKTIDDSRFPS